MVWRIKVLSKKGLSLLSKKGLSLLSKKGLSLFGVKTKRATAHGSPQ